MHIALLDPDDLAIFSYPAQDEWFARNVLVLHNRIQHFSIFGVNQLCTQIGVGIILLRGVTGNEACSRADVGITALGR